MGLAMGNNLGDAVADEKPDSAKRRLNFLRAMEGDDWRAVVNEQTLRTVQASASEALDEVAIAATTLAASVQNMSKELTVENVNLVLEAVRPVLIADGGNIEVIGVNREKGAVLYALLGECTTCSAAPST